MKLTISGLRGTWSRQSLPGNAFIETCASLEVAAHGYKPVLRNGHVHAIREMRDGLHHLILDERHICLISDLVVISRSQFATLIEEAFTVQSAAKALSSM